MMSSPGVGEKLKKPESAACKETGASKVSKNLDLIYLIHIFTESVTLDCGLSAYDEFKHALTPS